MSTPTAGETPSTADETPSSDVQRSGFYVRGWVLGTIGAVVVLVGAVVVWLAVRGGDGGDGGDGERRGIGREGGRFLERHGGGGHRGIAILVVLILIAVAIAATVFIVRRVTSRATQPKTSSAEALLAERFARGEIDEADYLSRRDALRG